MFELSNVVRFVSLLTYLGFVIGSISGFIEISNEFNLCEMFICILVLLASILALFLQITNYINNIIKSEKNILYSSSLFMLICSLLILGLSNIAVIFGVWGIIMSISTSVYAVFLNDDGQVQDNERLV
tara:strand:+ start:45 stop:428 length:384 start_codon:yes stop_codon:yes gene_type:complete